MWSHLPATLTETEDPFTTGVVFSLRYCSIAHVLILQAALIRKRASPSLIVPRSHEPCQHIVGLP